MASFTADLKTRFMIPGKLVIGIIDIHVHRSGYENDVVHAMRCALQKGVQSSMVADERQTPTKHQEEYLGGSLYVITQQYNVGRVEYRAEAFAESIKDLSSRVGCMALFVSPIHNKFYPKWISMIKEITGRVPICAIISTENPAANKTAKHDLMHYGISDIYTLPYPEHNLPTKDQIQWLGFLHGVVPEGYKELAFNELPINTHPRTSLIYENIIKEEQKANEKMFIEVEERKHEIKELERKCKESLANHEGLVNDNAILKNEMVREQEKRKQVEMHIGTMGEKLQKTEKTARIKVERLRTEQKDERARVEKENRSQVAEMTKKLESKQQRVDTLTDIVGEKERKETTLRQQVEELKKERDEDRARGEKEKPSLVAEMTNKLESKQQRVDTLTNIVGENKRNETNLRQQVEELKKEGDEDRARGEKEKRALAAEMTKKLESKQESVDNLTEIVGKKDLNETTLKQQVEESKKRREADMSRFEKDTLLIELSWKKIVDCNEKRMEQLERETWKLRTKIRIESEMRSAAEQKKRAETSQMRFLQWMYSWKKAHDGTSSQDNSMGGLGSSDTSQSGEDPTDDEFAKILKRIADDLTEEADIDSLGGQLGILQGNIERALKTNVKFNRVTSDGTRHMLKQWRRDVSREDEQIELRNALEAAKLVRLADLYLSEGRTATTTVATTTTTLTGAPGTSTVATVTVATVAEAAGAAHLPIHDGSQSAGVATPLRLSSEVNADVDDIMKKLAKALYKRSQIDELGSALGFQFADTGRYSDANAQQGMNYMGTLDMLRTWRKGQKPSTEMSALRSALLKAGLVNLADQFLRTSDPGDITPHKVQPGFQEPGSAQSNNGNDDTVDVRDGERDENDQEPQSAHSKEIGSTRALQISEEPTSEKPCCPW